MVPLTDEYDFGLIKNEAESLVVEELETQLKEHVEGGICTCHDCIIDMATLSLNRLTPIYRSSYTGIIYNQQYHHGEYKDKVEKVVKEAIERVSSNPSHETSY